MEPYTCKSKNPFPYDPFIPLTLSHNSPHLITNCDLPPPHHLLCPLILFNGDDNHSVLRALHLSQSRAKAAERQAELTTLISSRLATMLLDESLMHSAHKQWIMMLEFEVSALRRRLSHPAAAQQDGDPSASEIAWSLALAICLGIAGVGFAIGRHMILNH